MLSIRLRNHLFRNLDGWLFIRTVLGIWLWRYTKHNQLHLSTLKSKQVAHIPEDRTKLQSNRQKVDHATRKYSAWIKSYVKGNSMEQIGWQTSERQSPRETRMIVNELKICFKYDIIAKGHTRCPGLMAFALLGINLWKASLKV